MAKMDPRFREPFDEPRNEAAYYYTAQEVDRIIGTFTPHERFDRDAFVFDLESFVHGGLLQVAYSRQPALSPSQVGRQLRDLASRLGKVASTLYSLDPDSVSRLYIAAMDIAIRDGLLPDLRSLRPEQSARARKAVNKILGFDDDLEIARRIVPRLARVAQTAATNDSSANGRPSRRRRAPRPEPVYKIFMLLVLLFENWSTKPGRAYKDRGTEAIKGDLIDFLEACLRPLGYCGTRGAIYATYTRAKSTWR